MGKRRVDYDSAWKEALGRYFESFMEMFHPQAHGDIDWSRGYELLDKELKQVAPDAAIGPRRVDALVKVWRKRGEEAWVLVHVEVQGQEEEEFAERMYVYNYRLFDRYHRRVVSLAVLADERAGWRPTGFGYELWGCRAELAFPVVKLMEYRARWSVLEESANPFAIVVMAHLKAQETGRDAQDRKVWKLALTRRLYERGYRRQDVVHLLRFIDWVLQLPEGLDEEFWLEVQRYEEGRRMRYVTSVERIGIRKGMEKGLQQGLQQGVQQGIQQGVQQGIQQGVQQGVQQGLLAGIELGLELKFGSDGLSLVPEVNRIGDVSVLRSIHEGLKTADTLEELRSIYQ